MLKDMKTQVEGEGEDDTMAYDKYACWCKTVIKEKEAAIEEAATRIEELTTFLAEAEAKEAELKTDIEGLASDIEEDTDALNTATAIREKEQAAFDAFKAEADETLSALKQALAILDKVQLAQTSSKDVQKAAASLIQVRGTVQRRFPQFKDVLQRDLFDVVGSLKDVASQLRGQPATAPAGAILLGEMFLPKKEATALEQAAEPGDVDPSGLSGAAAGSKSYNSRSGQIFGILQEMFDEMGRDLKEAEAAEAAAIAAFAKLSAAKKEEIAAATAQKKMKEKELADLLAKAATAKEDMAALEEAKAADEELLANTKASYEAETAEYEARSKVRGEEIVALGEALKILTEDDARDLFGKTMTDSFLQTSSSTALGMQRIAERAMQRLATVARKHKDWALASLAVSASLDDRLDAFTKVIGAMDTMTKELKAQQQEEYEKSGLCKKQIDETEDNIYVKKNEEEDLASEHTSISNTIASVTKDIEDLSNDVSNSEVSLKQAGETRKSENQVFQQSISDQRATINILNKALKRLQMFYGNSSLVEIHAHRQEPGAAVAPPPPKPKGYEKSASSGGVMQVFMMIITDAGEVEAEISADEQKAQADYASFTADTTASIQADRSAIAEKEQQLAEAEGSKSETEGSQLANGEALGSLNELLSAHHTDCDWLLKYYDVRQKARQEELDAIADAKAILSGSNFGK